MIELQYSTMSKTSKTIIVDQRSRRTKKSQRRRRLKLRLVMMTCSLALLSGLFLLRQISSPWLSLLILELIIIVVVFFENACLRTKYVKLQSDKIDSSLKILQITDFHANRWVLKAIFRAIDKEQPDVIVLTGDIFDGKKPDNSAAYELIHKLPKNIPSMLIWGNHEVDYSDVFLSVKQFVDQSSTKMISGQTVSIGKNVAISGVDWGQKTELKIDLNRFNLLLVHNPETAFQVAKSNGFDLILCGHQHGGQVALPFIGGLIDAEVKIFPDLRQSPTRGLHQLGTTAVYICSGAGFSGLPIRFNNRAQISVIEILPISKS